MKRQSSILSIQLRFVISKAVMGFKYDSWTPVGDLCIKYLFISNGVFTCENSHRREFHTGMTFWFRITFTWWLGHFISCYLTVHFMLIKYTFGSKSQTLRMRYPFQSTGSPISHRNGWAFRVYMIPLRDFAPEWNSRSGARTGVNSRRGDSRRHNILFWYHVNKYRAMRGNRSELAPVSCKEPLIVCYLNINFVDTEARQEHNGSNSLPLQ